LLDDMQLLLQERSTLGSGGKIRTQTVNNRNLLFDFKHGDNRTPISPVRDIVKRFSSGAPQQSEIRTSTAENCPIFRHFCNTYPSAHPFSPDSAADSATLSLSIPSAPVAVRSGPASPRTAAGSDVLPPAIARSNVHVAPAVLRSSPARCCRLVSDQFSIRFGNASRRH
jgi:hypothetical protein